MCTYTFFRLCTEFHVACMQTKFSRSCPHHTEGYAGLYYTGRGEADCVVMFCNVTVENYLSVSLCPSVQLLITGHKLFDSLYISTLTLKNGKIILILVLSGFKHLNQISHLSFLACPHISTSISMMLTGQCSPGLPVFSTSKSSYRISFNAWSWII